MDDTREDNGELHGEGYEVKFHGDIVRITHLVNERYCTLAKVVQRLAARVGGGGGTRRKLGMTAHELADLRETFAELYSTPLMPADECLIFLSELDHLGEELCEVQRQFEQNEIDVRESYSADILWGLDSEDAEGEADEMGYGGENDDGGEEEEEDDDGDDSGEEEEEDDDSGEEEEEDDDSGEEEEEDDDDSGEEEEDENNDSEDSGEEEEEDDGDENEEEDDDGDESGEEEDDDDSGEEEDENNDSEDDENDDGEEEEDDSGEEEDGGEDDNMTASSAPLLFVLLSYLSSLYLKSI